MITILDVAKEANVSIATVSRVLNQSSHRVNALTRAKVLRVIDKLDYHPNALAQSLLKRRSMTIGIILPDISNPYYAEIVRGIQDKADEEGYSILIQNTDRKTERITRAIYDFRERYTDGIIFAGGVALPDKIISIMKNFASRAVVIGRFEHDMPSVRIDNQDAVFMAVSHLAESGYRDIAFVNGAASLSSTMADRLKGFKRALRHFHYPVNRNFLRSGALTLEGGYTQIRELIKARPRPRAVILANDQMAFGAVKAIKEARLRIPEDIALIGFDNVPLCSYFEPSITSIEIPRYKLGYAAMEILISLIAGQKTERMRQFKVELIKRQSTAPRGSGIHTQNKSASFSKNNKK